MEFFRSHAPAKSHFCYRAAERTALLEGSDYNAAKVYIAGGHFPLYQALAIAGSACTYLSFVRHPVDRLLSFYRFARRIPPKNSTAEAARNNDLRGFLAFLDRERPRIIRNQQCRFLATSAAQHDDIHCGFDAVRKQWPGLALVMLPSEQCTRAITAVAVAIGTEPADQGQPESRKVSPVEDRVSVDEEARTFIIDRNAEDLRLFRYVQQHYHAQAR